MEEQETMDFSDQMEALVNSLNDEEFDILADKVYERIEQKANQQFELGEVDNEKTFIHSIYNH